MQATSPSPPQQFHSQRLQCLRIKNNLARLPILWEAQGDCLLGDFGAASFHSTSDSVETRALQRMEVRAFGILLGELLERIDSGLSAEGRQRLEDLQSCC